VLPRLPDEVGPETGGARSHHAPERRPKLRGHGLREGDGAGLGSGNQRREAGAHRRVIGLRERHAGRREVRLGLPLDQDERAVCHVVTGQPDAGGIALLIAAAPDLLRLLEIAVGLRGKPDNATFNAWFDDAVAAIAAALGEP